MIVSAVMTNVAGMELAASTLESQNWTLDLLNIIINNLSATMSLIRPPTRIQLKADDIDEFE